LEEPITGEVQHNTFLKKAGRGIKQRPRDFGDTQKEERGEKGGEEKYNYMNT